MKKIYHSCFIVSLWGSINSNQPSRARETNYFGLEKYGCGQSLRIKGTGVNFKFGMIYQSIPELRLGVASTPRRSFP